MNCEIEFLPVGDASKAGDAIIVRYGSATAYELMIIDGGTLDSGQLLVDHVRKHFGQNAEIAHVVVTHADGDHASGIRTVLKELTVQTLWMHRPWATAPSTLPFYASKNWTGEGLSKRIFDDHDILAEIVQIAHSRGVAFGDPFTGARIGPFIVLSPTQNVYSLLVPQFPRTPDPDRSAIERTGFWIGKALQKRAIAILFEKAAEHIQKWFTESWTSERLRDGGQTSASNESSVVLYGEFGSQGRVLLTGDAGVRALTWAANAADSFGLPLQQFTFVQIPHHGSRSNVGPTILNRLIGPVRQENTGPTWTAFVSAPKDDTTHPRQMVLNAFVRRGARVVATQGASKLHYGGFPARAGYSPAEIKPFIAKVEDYD